MTSVVRFMTYGMMTFLGLLPYSGQAQSYGCSFLDLIMTEFQQKGHNYDVYSSILSSRMKSEKRQLSTNERIRLEAKIKDSLSKCCNHTSFFDDSLFHMSGDILLIDTFNFFSPFCSSNEKYGITVINNRIDLSCVPGKPHVVTVQSIRVYKDNFIITLRYPKNEDVVDVAKTLEAVDVKFELIAEYPPKLVKVERWYLE